jgi:hypothetical protein
VHKGLLQPDVVPEVTTKVHKEVVVCIKGREVGLPGIGNVSSTRTWQVTPYHRDETGPGMAPVLIGHLTFRLAIQMGGSDSEDALPD